MLRRVLIASVRLYQRWLSPLLGGRCRFHPTCSSYAIEAIEVHGSARGVWLALMRVARCHPGCDGSMDPVPPPIGRGR